MATRKDVRRDLKRQAIADSAAAVFAEHGILAATLDQIGAQLGLTKASLYYYYKSKDDLVAEVLRQVLEEIDKETAQEIEGVDDPLEKLKVRSRIHVSTAANSPSGKLIVSNLDALADNKAAATLLREHEEPVRRLLKEASEAGSLGEVDIDCATKLLFGAINNIPKWHTGKHGSLDEVFERTWTIFLSGVESRPAAASKTVR